ncbi:MAG: class I SAM-dependent methyltransferase [Paraglaciecola sp.]|uniref:class I SAM-dependent methyltransferase n=1 Tax=Paraglaciecola sp. TaxID=1920173 RepID=UPI0032987919
MNITDLKNISLKNRMPELLCEHPGMISNAERSLLFNLAKHYFQNQGTIIDAGAFLGASTVCFAQGLKEANITNIKHKAIWSFEKGIVRNNFQRFVEAFDLQPHFIGDSFTETFLALTANYVDYYKIHFSDILDYTHPIENNVEIAFLDILKTEKVCRHCIEQFFPALLEGAYVIQQDYFFDQLPFIKYTQEAFSEFFSYEGQVNSSALFKLNRPITKENVVNVLDSLSPSDAMDLHIQAEKRTNNNERAYFMQLSRAWLLADIGKLSEAKKHYRKVKEHFFKENSYSEENLRKDFSHRHNLLESYFLFMESWTSAPSLFGDSSWEAFIYAND